MPTKATTLEAQLEKLLGQDAKHLLKKTEKALAQRKPRKQIEKMMALEIARYMKKGLRGLPT